LTAAAAVTSSDQQDDIHRVGVRGEQLGPGLAGDGDTDVVRPRPDPSSEPSSGT
jgi:hypothetical protein